MIFVQDHMSFAQAIYNKISRDHANRLSRQMEDGAIDQDWEAVSMKTKDKYDIAYSGSNVSNRD